MNVNKAIEILFLPVFIAIIGIMFIIFRRQIGNFLYKWNKFIDSFYGDMSHMKTLLKPFHLDFKRRPIESYHRAAIKVGIVWVIGSIIVTLFLWVWGVI